MRIAPLLLPGALHIALGDVHATDESYPAVYHAYLAVIAVVHLAGKRRKPYRHERMHIDARFPHALKEGILHLPAAHVIVYQSDFHSLLRLVYQGISHQIAQGVILEDVGIQMDVMLRLTYLI